MDDSGLKK